MKSLIACQNEPSRGLSSASRLTALSSSSSAARCAARFVPIGVRKSRILSSAVGNLFASNSDDRARDRKASMHVSRRVLMTMLNAHTPLGVHYTALVQTARWKRGIIPHCMNDPQPEGHMASYLGRRKFLATLGGAAAWSFAVRAQQAGRLPTIGFLGSVSVPAGQGRWVAAFLQRLRELGWIEGRNFVIEYRWAEGSSDLAAEFAAEVVRLKVDMIVTYATPLVLAAKRATSIIPIVFAATADPVGTGLVASLAHPGGNVTGLSVQHTDLAGKRLELLREIVPNLRRLAIMAN